VALLLPVFNNNGAAGIAAGVNGTFCTIITGYTPVTGGFPVRNPSNPSQSSAPMIDIASYYIATGAGVFTAGAVTFYEQGADGNWRPLFIPTAITFGGTAPNALAANTVYNQPFTTGPFHGLQIQISGSLVGTFTYLELKGTIRNQ
jgi:hypothetical protein